MVSAPDGTPISASTAWAHVVGHSVSQSAVQEFNDHRHVVIPRRRHGDRLPLGADPPLRQGLHPGVPVERAHVSFGVRNRELPETSAVAGPGERHPAPHQIRLAGDSEPALPRKLPARNRDHPPAGIQPPMGNEPGMRARRQAGRAPGATGRPVAA
jgi:hypothetical protein